MTQAELSFNLVVEASVALVVMVLFVIVSAATVRERHRDVAQWHVLLGAAIYGALVGLVIGFIVVPMRALLMDGSLPPQSAALGGFGVLAVMMSLRRGLVGRLPFLGPQVKAFRRAMLRRTIEKASADLDKLVRRANGG